MNEIKDHTKQIVITPEVKEVVKPKPLQADDRGLLVGATFEEQWRLCSAYLKSGLFPKSFDTVEKLIVAIQFCRELGIPPITGVRQVYVINGTPALYGDLPMALALKSGQVEDLVEEIKVDDKGEPMGATCTIKRRGVSTATTRTFTVEDAKRAGLWGRGVWPKYPRRMLQCRARAWALKDLFSDMLNGAAILEYDHGTMPDEDGNVTSAITTRRSSLNDQFAPPAALTGDAEGANKSESVIA